MPVVFPNESTEPLWSFLSDAAPAAAWGMAFWLSPSGRGLTAHGAVLETGQMLWSRTLWNDQINGESPGVYIGSGRIYVAWVSYDRRVHVQALDPVTGRDLWVSELDYGLYGGPSVFVHQDGIYVIEHVEESPARFVQLDGVTGERVGSISLTGNLRFKPILARQGNVLALLHQGHIAAYDLGEEKLLWSVLPSSQGFAWFRMALTESLLIVQRGNGLEALERFSGTPIWHLAERNAPFAVAGNYLYTERHRIELSSGKSEIIVGEDLPIRPDWRFVGRNHWYAQSSDDQVYRIDLARPQLTELSAINERPVAVSGNHFITQTQPSHSLVRVGAGRWKLM